MAYMGLGLEQRSMRRNVELRKGKQDTKRKASVSDLHLQENKNIYNVAVRISIHSQGVGDGQRIIFSTVYCKP